MSVCLLYISTYPLLDTSRDCKLLLVDIDSRSAAPTQVDIKGAVPNRCRYSMVGGKVAVGLALASPLVYLYSLYLPRYYTWTRASAYMYTCKGSFFGSSSSSRRREETYISSLILLLKFLSSIKTLSTITTTTNFNPTQTQLRPNFNQQLRTSSSSSWVAVTAPQAVDALRAKAAPA